MKKATMIGLLMLTMSQVALAGDATRKMHGHHMHGPMHAEKMSGDMQEMAGEGNFLITKNIDGFAVSFHVMPAPKDMEMGGSHQLMIKVEQKGRVLSDLEVNSKITHPNEQSESKIMKRRGDWYMAAYDLDHPGPHQVMVLFKTADGVKHYGGVMYPAEE